MTLTKSLLINMIRKLGTKVVTGKSYSDAMSEWALRQENPELGVKRLKTRGEYINSQKNVSKGIR